MWLMPANFWSVLACTALMAGPVATTVTKPMAKVSTRRNDRDIRCLLSEPRIPTLKSGSGSLFGPEMFFKPGDDALDPVDAAVRPAEGEHEVRLGRVADHLHLAPQRAQDVKDHLAVPGRAAHVGLRVEEQERRVVQVDLHPRRAGQKRLDVLPGVLDPDRAAADEAPEVRGRPLAEQVGYRVLSHRGGED